MEKESVKTYNVLVMEGLHKEAMAFLLKQWRKEGKVWNYGDLTRGRKCLLAKETVTVAPAKKVEVKGTIPIKTLSKINGIGGKTVKDIAAVYNSVEELISDLNKGKEMPFRDDVVDKLRKELL